MQLACPGQYQLDCTSHTACVQTDPYLLGLGCVRCSAVHRSRKVHSSVLKRGCFSDTKTRERWRGRHRIREPFKATTNYTVANDGFHHAPSLDNPVLRMHFSQSLVYTVVLQFLMCLPDNQRSQGMIFAEQDGMLSRVRQLQVGQASTTPPDAIWVNEQTELLLPAMSVWS